jgi:hypothetical protein
MNRSAFCTLFAIALACTLIAADPVSRRDAERLQTKIDRITKNSEAPGKLAARTPISEAEVNAYLQFELGQRIPAGVTDPWVSILDGGRLSGRATVDLARVAQSRKSATTIDPFNYMSGSLPVAVDGVLRTKDGIGTFALESASISGVPVPPWMVQEILTYYSKSAELPAGVSLDKPFALPSRIREIQLARGQAIVVQ